MGYASVDEVARDALNSFADPIIVVNPLVWEDWKDQELDVFLNKNSKVTQVFVIERDAWISMLLGENRNSSEK